MTQTRTCLTVTVYELPAVLDPLVHRVEGGEPPPVWRLVLGAVYDGLGIVGRDCDCDGGDDQDP